jgi:hypothetical protein
MSEKSKKFKWKGVAKSKKGARALAKIVVRAKQIQKSQPNIV